MIFLETWNPRGSSKCLSGGRCFWTDVCLARATLRTGAWSTHPRLTVQPRELMGYGLGQLSRVNREIQLACVKLLVPVREARPPTFCGTRTGTRTLSWVNALLVNLCKGLVSSLCYHTKGSVKVPCKHSMVGFNVPLNVYATRG